MRRFYLAIFLCLSLLAIEAAVLLPSTQAKTDVIIRLLDLPAPPPPNPLAKRIGSKRQADFFNKSKPPKDDAPIDELLEYWQWANSMTSRLGYNPKPSERSLERIIAEVEKDPKLIDRLLNIFPDNKRSAEFVKELYDRNSGGNGFDKNQSAAIKEWLMFHSPSYSSELARRASKAGPVGEYVDGIDEIVSLARVDYEKAAPIIDRLYNDIGHPISQVLAKWARYKHALETDSIGDIERYRDELKSVVEDKRATNGMRDLAFDALVKEKDWNGRDEWYYSLLSDETLADLKVNGSSYTGLTTIVLYSADEKYVEKMIELVASDDPVVRAAAARNLVLKIESGNYEVAKALVPWLEDPAWAKDTGNSRAALVRQFMQFEYAPSVPGLIKMLDEKEKVEILRPPANTVRTASPGNTVAQAANAMATAANLAAAAANSNQRVNLEELGYTRATVESYPHRSSAIVALLKQKDPRAVPALRRILPEVENYEMRSVVAALFTCGGFTISEQMEALETAARGVRESMDAAQAALEAGPAVNAEGEPIRVMRLNTMTYSNSAVYTSANAARTGRRVPPTDAEIKAVLSEIIRSAPEISDELARAMVDRIEQLDTRDPSVAAAYRRMALKWNNSVINVLLLRDLKRDRVEADTVVRLLSTRKILREKHFNEVADLQQGTQAAKGFATCLIEDPAGYAAILEDQDAESKAALFACARLIRARLPVPAVAVYAKGPDRRLALAAERYLESEDSPEARAVVLSLHPNEIKILGATTAFFPNETREFSETLWQLFKSVDNNDTFYNGWSDDDAGDLIVIEKKLRNEIKKDPALFGVYGFDKQYVRIYKDRVIFSWDEDDSRYRERPLSKDEFDHLKAYLSDNNVDQLVPFVQCGGEYCNSLELLMLGQGGGRRVYVNGELPEFFVGLNTIFADLKLAPSKVKYALSKEMPELELLLTDDEMHVETVWKNGDDFRVGVSDKNIRKIVNDEIEKAVEETEAEDTESENRNNYALRMKLREKRQFEGFSWRKIANGADQGPAEQPPNIELVPKNDGLAILPTQEQWKARTSSFEIRAGSDGLFRAAGDKIARIQEGFHYKPLVTPNGKWVIVFRASGGEDEGLIRLNLQTKKFFPVEIEAYGDYFPYAYVPTLNKVLIARKYQRGEDYYDDAEERDDNVPGDPEPNDIFLLDPETGAMQPASGEFRPLTQETFRPLQRTTNLNQYWAAIPNRAENETVIGMFDNKVFGFRTVLRVPQITFNSMSMWVDEPGKCVYFVYRGHLLKLPLPK